MKCSWCDRYEAMYELAIYHLTELETYRRGKLYVRVTICEKCLPVTSVTEMTITETYERTIRKPTVPPKAPDKKKPA